jgi:hypothetical protein
MVFFMPVLKKLGPNLNKKQQFELLATVKQGMQEDLPCNLGVVHVPYQQIQESFFVLLSREAKTKSPKKTTRL